MKSKQAEYVYSKCKNEGMTGSEQVYDGESNDKLQIGSQLNPYECVMLNDFELYNIHAASAKLEKWS